MNVKLVNNLGLIKRITIPRLWNGILLYVSYQISRTLKRNIHLGKPISMSVEPTTACNLECPECPSGLRAFSRPTGNMKQNTFDLMVNELGRYLMFINFYFQGEPFIHPQILDLVKKASDKNIMTSMSTNAHFISDSMAQKTVVSGLSQLIISIDGTTQKVYEQYRKKGKLNKVLEGTKNIVHWKKKMDSKTPHIIFQFLVVQPNEHQIEEVFELAKEYEVDEVKLKTAQVYDYKKGNPLIPTKEKYSRYALGKDGNYYFKGKMLNQCWRMWSGAVMTWDGRVVPCCFDKDAKHQMGTISVENSFQKIWKNEAYSKFRKSILKSRSEIDICANCTEGTKVWVEKD